MLDGRGFFLLGGVELVEVTHEVASFRELAEIDLAAADEIEDDLTELGEGVLTAAVGTHVVEASATFAGAALDRVADDTGRGPEERTERASELRWTKPTTPSLACHSGNLASGLPSVPS